MTDDEMNPDVPPGWFRVTVETRWGTLRPQQVQAPNLRDALQACIDIPLGSWFLPDDEPGYDPNDNT